MIFLFKFLTTTKTFYRAICLGCLHTGYGPECVRFTIRMIYTDRNLRLTVLYGAGVLDIPPDLTWLSTSLHLIKLTLVAFDSAADASPK